MPRKFRDRTCRTCGKIFSTQTNIYCSKQCRSLDSNTKPRVRKMPRKEPNCVCELCGKHFYVYPKIAVKRRFCSRDCMIIGMAENSITKYCAFCGKAFTGTEPIMRRRKYCSLKCADRGRTRRVTKQCKECGETYTTNYCQKDTRLYCSKSCYVKYSGETSIEKIMREAIERRGVFCFQEYQFGRYVADFYLPAHFIVIECDGGYWHSSPYAKKRDKAKDKALDNLGITVFRFTGTQIKKDANKCVKIALS